MAVVGNVRTSDSLYTLAYPAGPAAVAHQRIIMTNKLSCTVLAAAFLLASAPALAQPGPDDPASDHTAIHQAAKEDRKADLATARSSSAPPQNVAADLLDTGYRNAAAKRYRPALLSSPGNPIKVNGQIVFATNAALTPDDRRTALYIQLLRLIGKSTVPPSAAKLMRAQIKATQKLVELTTARVTGQPVRGARNAAANGSVTSPAASAQPGDRLVFDTGPIFAPTSGNGNLGVQSLGGVPMMMTLPSDAFISTTFNPAQIDYNDKGGCANNSDATNTAAYRDAILRCFAHAVHNLRVQAAQDAVREYRKWKSDPYGFTPPAGFAYSAPARPVTDGNGHSLSIAGAYSLDASSAPDVRMFGEADAVNAFVGGDAGRTLGDRIIGCLQYSNAMDMPQLRAAIGDPPTPDPTRQLTDIASGTAAFNELTSLLGGGTTGKAGAIGAGGLAGAGIMSTETAYDAVMPFASRGFWDAAQKVFTGGVPAEEAEAGPPGLLAAFVTTMIEAGVDEGQKVIGNKDLPGDLDAEFASARSASDPTAAELAGSQSGRTELFTVFVGGIAHVKM